MFIKKIACNAYGCGSDSGNANGNGYPVVPYEAMSMTLCYALERPKLKAKGNMSGCWLAAYMHVLVMYGLWIPVCIDLPG